MGFIQSGKHQLEGQNSTLHLFLLSLFVLPNGFSVIGPRHLKVPGTTIILYHALYLSYHIFFCFISVIQGLVLEIVRVGIVGCRTEVNKGGGGPEIRCAWRVSTIPVLGQATRTPPGSNGKI